MAGCTKRESPIAVGRVTSAGNCILPLAVGGRHRRALRRSLTATAHYYQWVVLVGALTPWGVSHSGQFRRSRPDRLVFVAFVSGGVTSRRELP